MADLVHSTLSGLFNDIADEIRTITGSEDAIQADTFDTAIKEIASDTTVAAGSMLSGVTALGYDNGQTVKVTGTIATKTASDVTASGDTVTVPAGYYASAVEKAVDAGSATTPTTTITATPSLSIDSSTGVVSASVSASDDITPTVVAGYVSAGTAGTVSASGSNTLTLDTLGATTYNTSTTDQTIAAGQYLTGAQTIKAVTTENISAANLKVGVTAKVGDANDDDRILSVEGTFTSSSTVSEGQTAATADKILAGYSAWVDGAEVQGTVDEAKLSASGTGSATISSATFTYDSNDDNFDVAGTGTISGTATATTDTAGLASLSTTGTGSVSGTATLDTTVAKIEGSTSFSGTATYTPEIARTSTTAEGATNVGTGTASTTAPVSGYFVSVQSPANTGTIQATPSVTTAGYGTAANHGIAGASETVGANASDVTYITVAGGSATTPATTITANPSLSVDYSTGVVSASVSKSESVTPTVSEGYVEEGTAGTITVSGSDTLNLTTATVTEGTTTVSGTTATRGDYEITQGLIQTTTLNAASFANVATSGTNYVDISATTDAPVLVTGSGLYINKGYVDDLYISLARLVPDGASADLASGVILSGYSAYNNDGQLIAGSIATKTDSDITVSANVVTIPAGYYAEEYTATVTAVAQATPTISVDANGLITASATQTAGYVAAGTTTATEQLTALAATTYHPSTTAQTISAGQYLTGAQTIEAVTYTNTLTAHNVAEGVVIEVGCADDSDRIVSVTGDYDTYLMAQSF